MMQEPNAMAYAVDLSQEDLDHTLFFSEFEGGEAVAIDMAVNDRLLRGMDLQGCLMFGIPVPADLMRAVPKLLIVNRPRPQRGEGNFPPDFGVGPWGGFHLVSEAFVDIVERLEPAKHQFLRIEETVDRGRNPIAKTYYLMNILTRLDAVDVDHSSVRIEERELTPRAIKGAKKITVKHMHWISGRSRVLTLKRGAIDGNHLWLGMAGDIIDVGFSNTLFNAVHSAKLSPLEYIRTEEI